MAKVLVPYDSPCGHLEPLARAEAEGAFAAGAEVSVKRVRESVPAEIAQQMHYKLQQDAPAATIAELADYEPIIFGTPTRFGNVLAQIRNFLDQSAGRRAASKLAGKVVDTDVAQRRRAPWSCLPEVTVGGRAITPLLRLCLSTFRTGLTQTLVPDGRRCW
ncbi:MAG: NAD(P)H-dependent oxidoreductase [Rhodanobacter sp.]